MLMRQNKSSVELIDLSSNTCFHKVFARNIVLTESAKMDTANIDNWYLNNQQSKHCEIGIGTCTWKHVSLTDMKSIKLTATFQVGDNSYFYGVVSKYEYYIQNFIWNISISFKRIKFQLCFETYRQLWQHWTKSSWKLYFFSGLKNIGLCFLSKRLS